MERRNFIRLAGGGIVAAAAAGAAGAFALSPAYPAEAIEAWQGPLSGETDPRRRALAYAITAPNPHNLQPWIADLRTPGEITLHTDPKRVLPSTDPQGRQILVGHGAFIELLAIALAQQGLRGDVEMWPQGELPAALDAWDARPVARIRLGARGDGGAPDPLFAQILRRHTPKVDFDTTKPVSGATLAALLAGAGRGVRCAGTVDADALPPLRKLCWDSAVVELTTARTVMESVRLTRIGPGEILAHRDGISINSALPRIASALGQFDRSAPPLPGSPGYTQMMARFAGHSRTAMGFVWLSTPGNSRTQQVEAGRAYVRLQLKATELGLGVHPMSQALQEFAEMRPHYEQVHRALLGRDAPSSAGDETLQMFCRIGYPGDAVVATPRRALRQFERA
ncbi:Acg family FMN-binding oxidoreductase [Ramlibacter sp.]|uniref:Acg family FMN-binding oxidoreductase n=1 Tax=Ramlibacter sp. TaxID=1917967 RepID=UPI003D0DB6C5